jgi:hypothetical protein
MCPTAIWSRILRKGKSQNVVSDFWSAKLEIVYSVIKNIVCKMHTGPFCTSMFRCLEVTSSQNMICITFVTDAFDIDIFLPRGPLPSNLSQSKDSTRTSRSIGDLHKQCRTSLPRSRFRQALRASRTLRTLLHLSVQKLSPQISKLLFERARAQRVLWLDSENSKLERP